MKRMAILIVIALATFARPSYAGANPDSALVAKPAIDSTTQSIDKAALIQEWEYQREMAERQLQGTYSKEQRGLHDIIKAYTVQIATVIAQADTVIKFKKDYIH